MNTPILRLFVFVLVLFALLAGFTSWWSVVGAEDLRDNPRNAREVLEEQRTRRGPIRARGGEVIAGSQQAGGGTYARRYPLGDLFAFPVGYSYLTLGRTGLEQSRNDVLAGNRDGDVDALFESLRGDDEAGDEVRTTLDVDAQRAAYAALDGRPGAVVAIEPDTGKVRVMASTPSFDPNALRDARGLPEGVSTLNRATQGRYPPGSTMKVVTATAAIDSGRYTPQSTVNGRSPKQVSGAPLQNFGNQAFGDIPLTQALTESVNTVWAEVGVELGGETMQRYMERFGFYEQVPIDLPDGQRGTSGVRKRGPGLVEMTDDRVDVGRVAIGQGDLLVSPLQMAMVAATVANDGRRMRPTLTDRIVDRDGRSDDVEPEELAEVMSRGTARAVGDMMANVVAEGTGTVAALEGVSVAGKTGTAEKNVATRLNQPWFIGFAPREDPKIAVAVTVEEVIAGSGGTVAAPIARRMFEELAR